MMFYTSKVTVEKQTVPNQYQHPDGETALFAPYDFHPAHDPTAAVSELPHRAGMREFAQQMAERGSTVHLVGAVSTNASQAQSPGQQKIF
jgi:hypothetical protein